MLYLPADDGKGGVINPSFHGTGEKKSPGIKRLSLFRKPYVRKIFERVTGTTVFDITQKTAEPDKGKIPPSSPTVIHLECNIQFQTPRRSKTQKGHSYALLACLLACLLA